MSTQGRMLLVSVDYNHVMLIKPYDDTELFITNALPNSSYIPNFRMTKNENWVLVTFVADCNG